MATTEAYVRPFEIADGKAANVSTVYADAARAAEPVTDPLQMPENAMYGFAMEVARATDGPLAFAYVAALTMYAGMGVRCHKDGEQIIPRLFAALMADRGFGKSRIFDRLDQMMPGTFKYHLVTTTPVSAPSLAQLFAPAKDELPITAPEYVTPSVCLRLDELREMMANMAIQGSGVQFSSAFCTLFYKESAGTADKRSLRDYKVKLSILGALYAPNPVEFRRSFGSTTLGGLYDRFLFVPPPPACEWSDFWTPPNFYDINPFSKEPERQPPLTFDVEITKEALLMKKEWVDAAPLVVNAFGDEPKKADRMRLGEIALRIAAISAAINGDKNTSRACMQAALNFMTWQEKVRKVYKPGEGVTMDDECAQEIEEAFKAAQDGKPGDYYLRWRDIATQHHWYRKHIACLRRVRDSLIDGGLLEYKVVGEDQHGNPKYDKRQIRWAA